MRFLKPFIFFFCVSLGFSQQSATSAKTIENALQQKQNLAQQSLVKNTSFTNVGPTIMSGRVVDLAVNPNNPNEFYVGYASGGLWETKNNGTSFTPIITSQSERSSCIVNPKSLYS